MKRIITLAVALSLCLSSHAQLGLGALNALNAAPSAGYGVPMVGFSRGTGIVGGVNTSSLPLGELAQFESGTIVGYRIGIAKNIPLGRFFALQPELVACPKGALIPAEMGDVPLGEINPGAVASDIKARVTYIEVPVQLQAGFDLSFLRPYIFAEPFIGLAVNGKASGMDVTFNQLKERLEYGLSIGGGVVLFKHLQLAVRYYWNMEDVNHFKDYTTQAGSDLSVFLKNGRASNFSGAAITAGLFF